MRLCRNEFTLHTLYRQPSTIEGKTEDELRAAMAKNGLLSGDPSSIFFLEGRHFHESFARTTWSGLDRIFRGRSQFLDHLNPFFSHFARAVRDESWGPMFRGFWSPFIFVVKKEFSRKFFGDFVPRREFRACGKSLDNPIGMPRSFSQILAQRSPRKGFF